MAKKKTKKQQMVIAMRKASRDAELEVRKQIGWQRSNILNPNKTRRQERREAKRNLQNRDF